MPAPRTCPECGEDRVVSVSEAQSAFDVRSWGGQTSMLDYSELVCEYCKAVRIDGNWTRMQTVRDRAYELAQASSSKGPDEYRKLLREGEGI